MLLLASVLLLSAAAYAHIIQGIAIDQADFSDNSSAQIDNAVVLKLPMGLTKVEAVTKCATEASYAQVSKSAYTRFVIKQFNNGVAGTTNSTCEIRQSGNNSTDHNFMVAESLAGLCMNKESPCGSITDFKTFVNHQVDSSSSTQVNLNASSSADCHAAITLYNSGCWTPLAQRLYTNATHPHIIRAFEWRYHPTQATCRGYTVYPEGMPAVRITAGHLAPVEIGAVPTIGNACAGPLVPEPLKARCQPFFFGAELSTVQLLHALPSNVSVPSIKSPNGQQEYNLVVGRGGHTLIPTSLGLSEPALDRKFSEIPPLEALQNCASLSAGASSSVFTLVYRSTGWHCIGYAQVPKSTLKRWQQDDTALYSYIYEATNVENHRRRKPEDLTQSQSKRPKISHAPHASGQFMNHKLTLPPTSSDSVQLGNVQDSNIGNTLPAASRPAKPTEANPVIAKPIAVRPAAFRPAAATRIEVNPHEVKPIEAKTVPAESVEAIIPKRPVEAIIPKTVPIAANVPVLARYVPAVLATIVDEPAKDTLGIPRMARRIEKAVQIPPGVQPI